MSEKQTACRWTTAVTRVAAGCRAVLAPVLVLAAGTGLIALRMTSEPASGNERQVEAFFEAARVGDVAGMEQAVAREHLPVDLPEPGSGVTPLMRAVSARQAAAVEWLLAHGADVNACVRARGTALTVAADREDGTAMVRLLLDHGADPNIGTPDNYTPLQQAASWGDARSVAMLLGAGARPDVRDHAGNTIASLAEDNGYHAIAKMLREACRTTRAD
jgi:hypothetical protein